MLQDCTEKGSDVEVAKVVHDQEGQVRGVNAGSALLLLIKEPEANSF